MECLSPFLLSHCPRDVLYFVACGAINLITICALTVQKESSLSIDIFKLTCFQFAAQAIGCFLLILGFRHYLYDSLIHLIVLLTYARLAIIRKGDGDAEENTGDMLVRVCLAPRQACVARVHQW